MSAPQMRAFEVDKNHSIRLWCTTHDAELRGMPTMDYFMGDGNLMIDTSEMECPVALFLTDCEVTATIDASWVAVMPLKAVTT
jgi:hypothetical protein